MTFLLVCFFTLSCDQPSKQAESPPDPFHAERLFRLITLLTPEYARMDKPQPGDWLAEHPEPGQTFGQYLGCRPTLPSGKRRVIYVLPIGRFSPGQESILAAASSYLEAFYSLPVRRSPALQLPTPPAWAVRPTPSYALIGPPETAAKETQYHTGYMLNSILKPRLADDAAALIAFTGLDLWPGGGWNYVFGVGSTTDRVGVWSLSRFGNPDSGEYRVCLERALKLAVHETGHMFSMQHCVKHRCVMNGCNYLGETDRSPLDVCPQCLAKICWLARYDPAERFGRLAEFCRQQGFSDEADLFLARREQIRRE